MSIEYWVFFGVMVSIFATTFSMPLRFSQLFFAMILGIVGSLVGGVFAYMLYGVHIQGIDVSILLMTTAGAIFSVCMRRRIERLLITLRGGDNDAGWSI
jgi:uncharacterized membrane protein YeaQ/YmgE (transglycosylase-associated protein family)